METTPNKTTNKTPKSTLKEFLSEYSNIFIKKDNGVQCTLCKKDFNLKMSNLQRHLETQSHQNKRKNESPSESSKRWIIYI